MKHPMKGNTMNTVNSTSSALSDWVTLAQHELDAESERVKTLPEFREWVAGIMEQQEREGHRLTWTEEDCLRKWLDSFPFALSEPPLTRPAWATERLVRPWLDLEQKWHVEDVAQIGDTVIEQTTEIGADGRIEWASVSITIEGLTEPLHVDADQLETVMAGLSAAQQALAAE